LTRGEIIVSLYESARDIDLSHEDALQASTHAFDKMYTDVQVIWYTVYFYCRKTFSPEDSVNRADVYLTKVQAILDGHR
jgi:hypothetical protein